MAKWKTTQGKMLESEVEAFHDDEGTLMYRPHVRYVYNVNGRQYTGDKPYRVNYSTSVRRDVERFVAKRPVGALVEVHYNTEQPERSFLVNNVRVMYVAIAAALMILLLLLLIMPVVFINASGGPG